MKLSCLQENLNQGLFVVSHVASKSSNLPILNNVLLKAEEGVLKLLATNLEMGVTCLVRGKIETEGEFTVQSKLFSDYVALLPNERVDVELKDQNLEIKCQKLKTKIRGQGAADFPLIPPIEKKAPLVLSGQEFVRAVNQVIFSVSENEARPEISGVLLVFGKDNLTLAATDSYRLAEKKVPLKSQSKNEASVIVPTRTLQELLRILSGTKKIRGEEFRAGETTEASDKLEIYLSENQILFSFDNIELVSRTIEGQYPNYQQIIPREYKTKAQANVAALIKLVKTASLFSKSGIFDVSLEFLKREKEIEVSSANSQLGEASSRLEAEVEGEANKIVVNYRYLLDGLENLSSELVYFELTNDTSPCLLRPVQGQKGEAKSLEDYLYIIMPIKQ